MGKRIVVVAAMVLAAISLFLSTRPPASDDTGAASEDSHSPVLNTDVPSRRLPSVSPPTAPSTDSLPQETVETFVEPESSAVATDAATDWERKVDDILAAGEETDDDAKAGKLLDLLPSLSPAAQVEAARHIVNLTSDEHYSGIGRYLTNAATPVDVLDELFSDLLNRPNSVKLPRMLDIARNPQHPDASEARDVLELYLEDDYGGDWWKWEQKVNEWLKDNPD